MQSIHRPGVETISRLPLIINRLDNEAKSRADGIHVFVHQLLDDRSLACIV